MKHDKLVVLVNLKKINFWFKVHLKHLHLDLISLQQALKLVFFVPSFQWDENMMIHKQWGHMLFLTMLQDEVCPMIFLPASKVSQEWFSTYAEILCILWVYIRVLILGRILLYLAEAYFWNGTYSREFWDFTLRDLDKNKVDSL